MNKSFFFVFLLLFLLAPLPLIPRENVLENHAQTQYNYVYFNLNESKPIAIYFVYSTSVVPFVYFTKIGESTIVGFVPYNKVILIVSNYSFEVNGKVAGFNQYFDGYVYEFEVTHNMTLDIDFLPYPVCTTTTIWIPSQSSNTTTTSYLYTQQTATTTITGTNPFRQNIIYFLSLIFLVFDIPALILITKKRK